MALKVFKQQVKTLSVYMKRGFSSSVINSIIQDNEDEADRGKSIDRN